ncbi:hypothetical protein [Escherichia coli]|uniref:hypothetical protein n=1 Tax=Escherichia coli TaxID=562 RepID=UPI0021C1AC3C|nr:hypothetical protein [Escherichia coli]MCT8918763.1 hypothetical protein [Escherichia coli]HAW0505545.1 hypothetical protein [Escherichia coli]HAW4280146.1 hypothetical protein [Escherichia coli]HAW4293756.1 hypothetical protein [Escherichia coli]HBB9640798.1 hypothetical protein [Escherichia coli]
MMQLTWAGNYEEYKKFQSDLVLSNLNQSESYTDNRITHDSLHYWGDPRRTRRNRHTGRTEVYIDGTLNKIWYPYYDPNMIFSSEYLSTDLAGFFWVSKQYRINSEDPSIVNINRCCDSGVNTESIGLCSKLVNGGGFQYFERQAFSRYTYKFLSDDVINTQTETIQITRNRQEVNVVIDYTRQC